VATSIPPLLLAAAGALLQLVKLPTLGGMAGDAHADDDAAQTDPQHDPQVGACLDSI